MKKILSILIVFSLFGKAQTTPFSSLPKTTPGNLYVAVGTGTNGVMTPTPTIPLSKITGTNVLIPTSTSITINGDSQPLYPGASFTIASGTGSVQSVTGNGVDNTDPFNPIITPLLSDIAANTGGTLEAQPFSDFISSLPQSVSAASSTFMYRQNGTGDMYKVSFTDLFTYYAPASVVNTTITAGTGCSVTSTGQSYTISSPAQTLSITGQSLSISGGNTVTIPTNSTTIVAGANVTTTLSGTTYTVASTTPTITGAGIASVTGTYPTLTITATQTAQPTQSLSVSNRSLSITGGNTVTITYPWVTPEDFGAVGNGSTDDSTPLQAMYNFLGSNTNVTAQLMPGKFYRIVTTVTVTNHCTTVGTGRNSGFVTTGNVQMFEINGSYNTFRNVLFRGATSGGSGAANYALYVNGNAGLTLYRVGNIVESCFFSRLNTGIYSGLMVGTASGGRHQGAWSVSNCVFDSLSTGILFNVRGEYNTVSNCKFNFCTVRGIYNAGGNNQFIGGHIVDCAIGFEAANGTNDNHCSVVGMAINHNTINVRGYHTMGITFEGCPIYAGNIILTGTGKTMFRGCQLDMASSTFSATNSPSEFSDCQFDVLPTTYTVVGTAPIVNDCYNGTTKLWQINLAITGLREGTATLSGGTVTITNATVGANTIILYNRKTLGTNIGNLSYTITNGTSFTINSDAALDNGTVVWQLKEINQ